MNVENLRTLAHELRADPESYHQGSWGRKTDCGTVACIAGFAYALARSRPLVVTRSPQRFGLIQRAQEWMGLTAVEAQRLFYGAVTWPAEHQQRFWRAEMLAEEGAPGEAPAFVAADLLDALADGTVTL